MFILIYLTIAVIVVFLVSVTLFKVFIVLIKQRKENFEKSTGFTCCASVALAFAVLTGVPLLIYVAVPLLTLFFEQWVSTLPHRK